MRNDLFGPGPLFSTMLCRVEDTIGVFRLWQSVGPSLSLVQFFAAPTPAVAAENDL